MKSLNERAAEIHKRNYRWWHDADGNRLKRNKGELLMLVLSELAEAMEGERKDLMDDHLPHRKCAEVECADAYIRLLDFAAGNGIMLHDVSYSIIPEMDLTSRAASLYIVAKRVARCDINADEVSNSLKLIERYCLAFGYDLWGAMSEKLLYNDNRPDHKWEARQAAGGKKF